MINYLIPKTFKWGLVTPVLDILDWTIPQNSGTIIVKLVEPSGIYVIPGVTPSLKGLISTKKVNFADWAYR